MVFSGMLRRVALRRRYVPPKRRFLQEPHDLTSQKTPFFIVTAVKTSYLTRLELLFRCNETVCSGAESKVVLHGSAVYHSPATSTEFKNGGAIPPFRSCFSDTVFIYVMKYRMAFPGMLRRVAVVRTDIHPKRRFLQQPYDVTSQKTAFFVVTVVKTSNLT
jgi:hypothetical protein